MYVYISPKVQAAANRNDHLWQRIQSVKAQLEQGDPLLFGLLFSPRHPHWVKRIRRANRLIATFKQVHNEAVFCFTHFLPRSSSDYRKFLDDPEGWGNHNIEITPRELENWWAEQQESVEVAEPLTMPESLRPWLEHPHLLQREDQVIFESSHWVEQWRTSDSELTPQGQTFHHMLFVLLEGQTKGSDYILEETHHSLVKKLRDAQSNCTIVYSHLCPIQAPHRQVFFLLAAYRRPVSDPDVARLGASLKLFGNTVNRDVLDSVQNVDDLARYARRSYPNYLVADPEIWLQLEQESEANLALSGEEEELLHEMQFPAFINGRAGSGKSTMLHYAFAYYCSLYLKQKHHLEQDGGRQEPILTPLFLTYSDRLTDRAKLVVRRILSSHSHYIDHQQTYLKPELLDDLEDCFQPFQRFLLEQLSPEEREKFPPHRYISFHRFKQFFTHSFNNYRHSSETCWHVIRTYIKGFDFSEEMENNTAASNRFLSWEEYRHEVYESHKSLSDDDFQEIYENVWPWYQNKQIEHSYWDDQDLVRTILLKIVHHQHRCPHYAAIFCDESQDFTRIELQIILRLSTWTQYRLLPPVHSLPFAFAGDPMQTLNPTGFDWTSFRASFYDRILQPLDPKNQIGLCGQDYNFLRELRQNYRSTASLVHFSNVVHLWRRIFFNMSSLQPQIPWWPDDAMAPPQQAIIGKNLMALELKKMAQEGVMFLLPCDEGGELDFLRQYPFGPDIFPDLDHGVPPNVYTSVAVKGMEFSPVIIFGFGDYFAQEFANRSLPDFLTRPKDLKLEYFLNKLYVAVSRSTRILGIVDAPRGNQVLWGCIGQAKDKQTWLDQLPASRSSSDGPTERQIWETHICHLRGSFNTHLFQNENPLEYARAFLSSGLERQDAQFLTSAAYYFEQAQQLPEVNYCQAWLQRLGNDLKAAGEQFMAITGLQEPNLDPIQDAWHCFWQGQHWPELLDWYQRYPERAQSSWQAVAQYMLKGKTKDKTKLSTQIKRFTKFLQTTFPTASSWAGHRHDSSWKEVLHHYSQDITLLLEQDGLDVSTLKQWQSLLANMAEAGFEHDANLALAARCAYLYQDYGAAVANWEQCQQARYSEHKDYYDAKAQVATTIPDKVRWLNLAQKLVEIVELWQTTDKQITEEWEPALEALRRALNHQQEQQELLELDLQQGYWLWAIQRLQQWQAGEETPEASPSLAVLQRLAEDSRFQGETIAQELRKRFSANDRYVNELLNFEVSFRLWDRLLWRARKRLELTDDEIRELTTAPQEELRSAIFQILSSDRAINAEDVKKAESIKLRLEVVRQERLLERLGSNLSSLERSVKRQEQNYRNLPAQEAQQIQEGFIQLARRDLCQFLTATTQLEAWPGTLPAVEEAGTLFERIGEFGPSLKFYERFRKEGDEAIREQARQRWIAVKQAQATYHDQMSQPERASRMRQESELMTPERWWIKVDTKARELRQQLSRQLEAFSLAELQQVVHYLSFLEFQRSMDK